MITVHIVDRSFQPHFERYFLDYYDKLLINNSLKYASHGFSGTFVSNNNFNSRVAQKVGGDENQKFERLPLEKYCGQF